MEIRPFRGWRHRAGEVSGLIAPPYDILTQADKDALLAGDARNIVAVDLPHCPPAGAGPDGAYQAAAATLRQWMAEGLLARDARPCLYAYRQTFLRAGRRIARRAIIAAVRLAEFGDGVWPHEKTFPGPKADRLRLTQETGVQLSPILGFYEDDGSAGRLLFEAAEAGGPSAGQAPPAHQTGTLRGVEEELWAVTDEPAVAAVCAKLNGRPLFIADGHHRYTTALNYRASLGPLPPDDPRNFVMFVLAGMSDPGLTVLPTHRVITGLNEFDLEGFVNATRRVIAYTPIRLSSHDVLDADALLRPHGPHAMAFAARSDGGPVACVGVLKDLALMRKVAVGESDAWRELDVSILHRLILDHFLMDCKTPQTAVEYFADGPAALAAAECGRADLAVFLQATPLEAVKAIALAGAVMPHKSTYFYPKPATGMVLYPLKD